VLREFVAALTASLAAQLGGAARVELDARGVVVLHAENDPLPLFAPLARLWRTQVA